MVGRFFALVLASLLWPLTLETNAYAAGSSDLAWGHRALGETDACTDDWESLVTTLGQVLVSDQQAFLLSLVTCSEVVRQDAETVTGVLETLGQPTEIGEWFSCKEGAPEFLDYCTLLGGTDTFCSSVGNLTAASFCCASCAAWRGDHEAAEDEDGQEEGEITYSFGQAVYEHETEAFLEFLRQSGFREGLAWPTQSSICSWWTPTHDGDQMHYVDCRPNSYNVHLDSLTEIAPEVGQLQYMKEMEIRLPSATTPFELPVELANCSRLSSLTIDDAPLMGTLSALSPATQNLQVVNTGLTGLSSDLFLNTPLIKVIDVSNNSITGSFPELDMAIHTALQSVTGTNNKFTGVGTVYNATVWTGPKAMSIDLSGNELTEFPESIRTLRRLLSLDLSNNKISSLPGWGYWPEHFWDVFYDLGAYNEFGESYECPWLYMTTADANLSSTVPTWPVLTKVVMDGNDFGAGAWANDELHPSVRRFLSFFAQAVELSILSCNNCSLSGKVTESGFLSILHFFEPAEEETEGTTKTVCVNQASYKNLQSISLLNSPGIVSDTVSCEIMDAEHLLNSQLCYACAEGSLVPTGVSPMLSEQADCTCAPTLITGYANGGPYCGCASGSYYDETTTTCRECPDSYDCDWNDDIVLSRTLPQLRPGYWAECISNRSAFDPTATHECLSSDVCTGGPVHAESNCSESSLCDSSRSGYGCATCLPGQTGLPGEPCGPCFSSPSEVRLVVALGSLAMIPCFIPLIYAIIDTGTKGGSRQGWVQIKRLKSALRGLLRHLQLIGVFYTVNIEWPDMVVEVMKSCQMWSARFDGIFQFGCMTTQQSGIGNLLVGWLTPLYIAVLVILSVMLYEVVNWLLHRFMRCGFKKHMSIDSGFIFIHFLWVVYFASLTNSVLYVFTCKSHSDGKVAVLQYPDVACDTLDYLPVAAGGFLAFLIYVVLFFIVSYMAMKRVQRSLVETSFEDKGPFEFAVDGLRVPCLQFNLLAAMKDVVLNMIIVMFVNEAVGQLLVSAGVLIAWSIVIAGVCPYDAWTANWLDVSASGGLGALLLTTAGFGFAVPGTTEDSILEEVQGNGEVWLSILLFLTVGVPNLLVLLEIGKLFPQFESRLPKWLQSPSAETVLDEIRDFKASIPSDRLYDTMEVFDFQEWKSFQHVFGTNKSMSKSAKSGPANPEIMDDSSSWAKSTPSCGSPFQRKCSLDLASKSKLGSSTSSLAVDQKDLAGSRSKLGTSTSSLSVDQDSQQKGMAVVPTGMGPKGQPLAPCPESKEEMEVIVDTTPPRTVDEDPGHSRSLHSENLEVIAL